VELPNRLSPDMISEALFEMRFEHTDLSEMVTGRLSTRLEAQGWKVSRLPAADLPEQVRLTTPAMRFLPILEMRSAEGQEIIRVGPHVLSHHVVGDYMGWSVFQPKLLCSVNMALSASQSIRPVRLGLRYMNAPTTIAHGIRSVHDLNLSITVAGSAPASDLQLIYRIVEDETLEGLVRIVTSSFIEASPVPEAVAVVDIDMFTPDSTAHFEADNIASWLEKAHDVEKRTFFGLLTPQTIATLKEQ